MAPTSIPTPEGIIPPPSPPPSTWDRLATWASENKVLVYTVGAIVIVSGAGAVYFLRQPATPASSRSKQSKKDRRKAKKEAEGSKTNEPVLEEVKPAPKPSAEEEPEEDLPEITEENVDSFSLDERKQFATKLKAKGNVAFGSKDYVKAIELYGKAILCKKDPVYYSNRAACYNALGDWEKVIEDTTAALSLDQEYVKALNRRANAYEQTDNDGQALLDYTASCIMDYFKNEKSNQSIERLLRKVAEKKGKAMLENKVKKLPSSTFVTNYLKSFRDQPLPEALKDPKPESGHWHLAEGLKDVERHTNESYEFARQHFEKAVEVGELGDEESLAYNWRGTFKYLIGDIKEALSDLTHSIECENAVNQSFVKKAAMQLEDGNRDQAVLHFEQAEARNPNDPDIFYHRAQLHFLLNEYQDAAKDYQRSIDLDKDFMFSHIQLGVTQYKLGSIASSMATFRRCIKNFEKQPDVYNYYGELLLDQQKYEEAIAKFDTAIDMEKQQKPTAMNVLPLINKALALFQWKKDLTAAEKLCDKALIIDPECDIAVATMAQLLLNDGKVPDALRYFERAAELSRTEAEIVNALSYAEATRTQLEVSLKYPQLAERMAGMAAAGASMAPPR